jgi:hypothetical protein
VLATSDGVYAVERADEIVSVNQKSKTAEYIIEEDPKKVVNPDFYSDAYWSTSLEKRSKV